MILMIFLMNVARVASDPNITLHMSQLIIDAIYAPRIGIMIVVVVILEFASTEGTLGAHNFAHVLCIDGTLAPFLDVGLPMAGDALGDLLL